jgi:hypothetical protein
MSRGYLDATGPARAPHAAPGPASLQNPHTMLMRTAPRGVSSP